MTPRLEWTRSLLASVQRATGGQIKSLVVEETVDPIKKILTFQMHEPFRGGDYNAFTRIIHYFANANECAIGKIWREGVSYRAELFTKRRFGPAMNKNPILQEKQR